MNLYMIGGAADKQQRPRLEKHSPNYRCWTFFVRKSGPSDAADEGEDKADHDALNQSQEIVRDLNNFLIRWNQLNALDYHEDHMDYVAKEESARYRSTLQAKAAS